MKVRPGGKTRRNGRQGGRPRKNWFSGCVIGSSHILKTTKLQLTFRAYLLSRLPATLPVSKLEEPEVVNPTPVAVAVFTSHLIPVKQKWVDFYRGFSVQNRGWAA